MKADVYSFGVLILEIISGRSSGKPNLGDTSKLLLEWVCCFPFSRFIDKISISYLFFFLCYVAFLGFAFIYLLSYNFPSEGHSSRMDHFTGDNLFITLKFADSSISWS